MHKHGYPQLTSSCEGPSKPYETTPRSIVPKTYIRNQHQSLILAKCCFLRFRVYSAQYCVCAVYTWRDLLKYYSMLPDIWLLC